MIRPYAQTGQTIIEVLVTVALAMLLLPALLTAYVSSRDGRDMDGERLQATAVLRETDEAVRLVRNRDWDLLSALTPGSPYHPVISGGTWALTSGGEAIGSNINRQVVTSTVQRNTAGAIVTSGGTVDPSTLKVVSTVSWTLPVPGNVANTTYYTRYQANAVDAKTTQANFNAGACVATRTTLTADGEVGLPTAGNWNAPSLFSAYDTTGTTDATDIYVDNGYAYLANQTNLYIFNICDPSAPTLVGTYAAGTGNTINDVSVAGNYAYLATASDTAELTVVNVTNRATPTLAGSLNLGDTADATSVFTGGGYAYLGKTASATNGINEFYVVNVATPTAPNLSGSLNLTANVNSVYVVGNFAYLATSITTAELTIVNVTTKTAPAQAGVYNTAGTVAAATDVFTVGTTVYLVEAVNSGGAEFFIINAANPAATSLTGSYEANASLNAVYAVGTRVFVATAAANAQFAVFNVATPSAPAVLGTLNLGNTTNDVFMVGDYAYLASTSNTQELTLSRGGTGLAFGTSGTYESPTFDAGGVVGFNYLNFTATEPTGTDVQFQIATNTDNATWNFVGPDGTSGTSFGAAGAIPLSAVKGQYFRYKATLTGGGSTSPTLSDTAVNYSP